MPNVTASTVETLLNLDGQIANETIEAWIDQAIDMLNLEGADLPNMSGTAGSKTVGLESMERAAVNSVVRIVYYSFYKDIQPATVSGLTLGTTDLLSNPAVAQTVKDMARRLAELDVSRG